MLKQISLILSFLLVSFILLAQEEPEAEQEEKKASAVSEKEIEKKELTPPVLLPPQRLSLPETTEKELLKVKEETEEEEEEEYQIDIFELHGYFRVRPSLFHNFHLGWDDPEKWPFPPPLSHKGLGINETGCDKKTGVGCYAATLAGANMRFQLNPQLNISEEVRIKARIDMLDNIVLGTNPNIYYRGGGNGTYSSAPLGIVHTTQISPRDSVKVKRVWGEVRLPVGEFRFGRMGSHWGLGILTNSGDCLECDSHDTVDRLLFATRIRNIIVVPAIDFGAEGPAAGEIFHFKGQPYDPEQKDDLNQYLLILAYKLEEERVKRLLRKGKTVLEGGFYFAGQSQTLFTTKKEEKEENSLALQLFKREVWTITPDIWFKLLWKHLHIELEALLIYGHIRNINNYAEEIPYKILQYGWALQIDYGFLEGDLTLGLGYGHASGDDDVEGLNPPKGLVEQSHATQDRWITTFPFNPSYHVDLVLFREILGQVIAAYYFKTWIRYIIHSLLGEYHLGMDILYSRASSPVSTLGNSGNLGIELDLFLGYKSKDMFHVAIRYGVLFPLGAFNYLEQHLQGIHHKERSLKNAQTLQGIFAISF